MTEERLLAAEEQFEAGRFDAVAAACRHLLAENPRCHEALDLLGRACLASGRAKEAVELLGRAVHLAGTVGPYHSHLGEALLAAVGPDEAIASFRRAVALAPNAPGGHAGLARALLAAGDGRAALATCDAFMASHPYHGGLVGCRALLLCETGSRPAAERLLGLETLVRLSLVAPPAAFGTLEAFHEALVEEAGNRPGEDLFVRPGPAGALLIERIDRAVRDYRADLADDPNHPLVANAPRRWSLTGRAIALGGAYDVVPRADGWAWIGGLYCLSVPDAVAESGPDREGWIEFGRPPSGWPMTREPIIRRIRPEPGRMILFPAYVYHRTIPFSGGTGPAAQRICYAFSVLTEG